MVHYICTGGCGGVSETPGVCQTEGCSLHGEALKECNCEDGKHEALVEKEADPSEKTEEVGSSDGGAESQDSGEEMKM